MRDAVECHFDDEARPKIIRHHFVRDEVITAGDCHAADGTRASSQLGKAIFGDQELF